MSTAKTTVNAYNKFAEYWREKLSKGENIGHKYLEKPAMYNKLPDLKNKSVICIGSGAGEECEYLLKQGAKRVVGIDISPNLIEQAKAFFPKVEFHVMDMEKLSFEDNTFDFAYSSLTLHYVKDWRPCLNEIKRVIKPGAKFLFSTHHPLNWGADTKKDKTFVSTRMGFVKKRLTGEYEVYGDYLNTRKINDVLFGEIPITYYNKPISAIFSEIRETGFQIVDFLEPKPLKKVRKIQEFFWEIHSRIPMFMIFELQKPK